MEIKELVQMQKELITQFLQLLDTDENFRQTFLKTYKEDLENNKILEYDREKIQHYFEEELKKFEQEIENCSDIEISIVPATISSMLHDNPNLKVPNFIQENARAMYQLLYYNLNVEISDETFRIMSEDPESTKEFLTCLGQCGNYYLIDNKPRDPLYFILEKLDSRNEFEPIFDDANAMEELFLSADDNCFIDDGGLYYYCFKGEALYNPQKIQLILSRDSADFEREYNTIIQYAIQNGIDVGELGNMSFSDFTYLLMDDEYKYYELMDKFASLPAVPLNEAKKIENDLSSKRQTKDLLNTCIKSAKELQDQILKESAITHENPNNDTH